MIEVSPRDRRRFKRLQEESKNFESLPIRTRLTEEEVARFAVNRYRFPGFEIKARLFRSYPHGDIASHAVGYIGRINEADVRRIESLGATTNYKGTDHIGKLGIEGAYEKELHGTTGSEQRRDRRGRPRHPRAVALRAAVGQQPVRHPRREAAAGRRGGVPGLPRRARGARPEDGRRAGPRLASPGSTPTSSSTASIPPTGTRSTTRPTSRSTTARFAASTRRARPSSRSWRWPPSPTASARPSRPSSTRATGCCPASRAPSATGSPAATGR